MALPELMIVEQHQGIAVRGGALGPSEKCRSNAMGDGFQALR